MLTKSLHTVTAVKNVATYVYQQQPKAYRGQPRLLCTEALRILGYAVNVNDKRDDTVQRCLAAVTLICLPTSAS
jgi:hypothetical protein